MQAADDAGDGFAVEVVAEHVGGQAVAAEDIVAGARGRARERAVRHPRRVHAALHVGDAAPGRPR